MNFFMDFWYKIWGQERNNKCGCMCDMKKKSKKKKLVKKVK